MKNYNIFIKCGLLFIAVGIVLRLLSSLTNWIRIMILLVGCILIFIGAYSNKNKISKNI